MSASEHPDRPHILIVDDNKTNSRILSEALKEDYTVSRLSGGYDALTQVLSGSRPDIILLDVMMPDIDGYEVCRILKANSLTREIPIIFITARGEEQDERAGLEAGAVDYITKPVSLPIVRSRVRTQAELLRYRRDLECQVEERTREMVRSQRDIIERLAHASEYRDNETGRHIQRISRYTAYLARAWGMGEEEADQIFHASTMHDIGKIGIPDRILLKQGSLNGEEWMLMKQHTTIGADLLAGGGSRLIQLAESIALTHHERWDGRGYPAGLRENQIPLEGRLVAVCDVFDALTSRRPYKPAWSSEGGLAYIWRESGRTFDPAVVKLFQRDFSDIRRICREWEDGDEEHR